MTTAVRHPCPHCQGSGFRLAGAASEAEITAAEITAIAVGLRQATRAAGAKIIGDDRVTEATAAILVCREPGTLRNWRGLHQPIPFRKLAGRVSYRIADIARWVHENGQSGEE